MLHGKGAECDEHDCASALLRLWATALNITECKRVASIRTAALQAHHRPEHSSLLQETWGMLPPDAGMEQTVVAVAIAKLSEPAVVAAAPVRGSFMGTGKAASAAAGRLSYVWGLKVLPCWVLSMSRPSRRCMMCEVGQPILS